MLPLLISTVTAAEAAVQPEALLQRGENHARTLATARADVRATQERQASLAHRIQALKRLRTTGRLTNEAELERLLRASVAADEALAARQREADDAERAMAGWVRGSVQTIDREIRSLVPRIKAGSLKSRRAAAARIEVLRIARRRVGAMRSALRPEPTDVRWRSYLEVSIAPLDGPTELREKADFVEDTRDKFTKKRKRIMRLLADARQEREIRLAASEFRSDAALFDEETRTTRVVRQPGAQSEVLVSGDAPQERDDSFSPGAVVDMPQPGPPPTDMPVDPAVLPGSTAVIVGNAGAAPSFQSTEGTPGRTTTAVPLERPTTPRISAQGTQASSTAPAANTLTRPADPQSLLVLRVADLAGSNPDPEELERILTDFAELDAYLARQAKLIRDRARQLESDEARARGH